MGSHWFFTRHGNIALYLPNLIGYLRIACSLTAFGVASKFPLLCIFFYFLGFVCDDLDGRAARAFNQTSTLGAVLDMLTDRLSTAGLLVILCMLFPRWYTVFLLLICLDIFSHWLQMYSSLVAGDISHKETHNQSWLVSFYYTHRLFMGFCCVCCEVLYLAIYLLHWERFWAAPTLPARLPGWAVTISGYKAESRFPLILAIALAAIPGVLVKQLINCAQLRAAVSSLVQLDLLRDAKGKTKKQEVLQKPR